MPATKPEYLKTYRTPARCFRPAPPRQDPHGFMEMQASVRHDLEREVENEMTRRAREGDHAQLPHPPSYPGAPVTPARKPRRRRATR